MKKKFKFDDPEWISLALCKQLAMHASSPNNYDGIIIEHDALKKILKVDRIYEERLSAFAESISYIFPFSKIYVDNRNARVLGLGFNEKKEPQKYLWCAPQGYAYFMKRILTEQNN